ncbi:Vinorine synthase [Actinidia chinensis var. chinensis]|uniref:Vinorine synthase n=1 Tax=Actinidia chinensis var. chinensis TaxID=1590841 RepID=A0A2R6PXQ1_ACTCC|nr:Vinorine synthase [Actinidia chinensis var. chinensis]
MVEVEVISEEVVKPSSPTPPHLRTYKVSLLDQNAPTSHEPIIFFYPRRGRVVMDERVDQLKHSLSETLTRFYPLAGRFVDRLCIDCNDQGALFYTARIHCSLADVLSQPHIDLESLRQFLPVYVLSEQVYQVAIQVNLFTCGGLAISVFVFHKVIDATTMTSFFTCWSSIHRGSQVDSDSDCTSAASLFPPNESLPTDLTLMKATSLFREGKCIIQRYVFTAEALSAMKAKSTSQRVPNPTRIEALTCFLWKHGMAASRATWGGSPQPSILCCIVDLRRRLVPLLSKNAIGNILWKVITQCDKEESLQLDKLVAKLRATLKKTRDGIASKLQGEMGYYQTCKLLEEFRNTCARYKDVLNPYALSSLCNMGLNQVDFGWGKPIWVSSAGGEVDSDMKNFVRLMDGVGKDEIDAWVALDKREMLELERDPEFLALATPNPGIPILFSTL